MKSLIALLSAVLFAFLILTGCSSESVDETSHTSNAPPTAFEPRPTGNVVIVCGGEVHEPFVQFLSDTRVFGGMEESRSGSAVEAEELFERLAAREIQYTDEFQILLEGIYSTEETMVRYTLYSDDFERVLTDVAAEDFELPNEAGVYLLSVVAWWTRNGNSSVNAYLFLIRV